MHHRQCLSGLFKSEWIRFVSLTFGILFGLAVALAVYSGDWALPGFLAILMIAILVRAVIFLVFVFWPIMIAILMVWTGHKVLFKKKPVQTRVSLQVPS